MVSYMVWFMVEDVVIYQILYGIPSVYEALNPFSPHSSIHREAYGRLSQLLCSSTTLNGEALLAC